MTVVTNAILVRISARANHTRPYMKKFVIGPVLAHDKIRMPIITWIAVDMMDLGGVREDVSQDVFNDHNM